MHKCERMRFPSCVRRRTLFVLSVLVLALSVSLAHAQTLQRFAYEAPKLGTTARLVFFAPDSVAANRAAAATWARIDTLNAILSDYLAESELNRLSVSDDLWAVLVAAQRMAARTNGAFDVTVGPVTKLWRWAFRRQVLPPPDRLTEARRSVGYPNMVLDSATKTVRLTQPGMRLDLGGIAKGYIADEALTVLKAYGQPHALVDLGGDVVAGAPPPGTEGWTVAMPNQTVPLVHAALATSGDTYRHIEVDGVRYSHIVDPTTGLGVTHRTAVTVHAPTAMVADAWASALSVLGEAAGRAILSRETEIHASFFPPDVPPPSPNEAPR